MNRKRNICELLQIEFIFIWRLSETLVLEVHDGPNRYAAGSFDFGRITAVAVTLTSDGRHLDGVQGIRLQAGDVAL